MIDRERKTKKKNGGKREGWWQGGLNMMQTIWSRERRLPAQPALFKLERKWPYIQHASKLSLSLSYCLSVSPLSPLALNLAFFLTHGDTHIWLVQLWEAPEKIASARALRRARRLHTPRSNDGHWFSERVCYSNIMFLYITVTSPIAVIIVITIITIWTAAAYMYRRGRVKAARVEEESQENGDWKMKDGAKKGRRGGQRFPLNTRPWLNLIPLPLRPSQEWGFLVCSETHEARMGWKGKGGMM